MILPIIAVLTGALIPVQAATNAAMSKSLGSVVYSALILFVIGLLFIASFAMVNRIPLPSLSALSNAPAFSYAGGFIVASYVLAITYLAPRLGVANAICFIVSGQIIAAVVIDHFGLLGAIASPITFHRATGMALMIAGLFLARH
ncbi:MAG: DMT family transporter [Pseudomonadales bacterium]|nr:DMT family transporter [Pseudomonadales bacterium]